MLTSLLLLAALGQVPAQNVRPQIGYVYPPGGAAGTTIDVRLGIYDPTPDMQIICHDPRVKIEISGPPGDFILTPPPYWFGLKAGQPQPPLAREVPARITLAADLPPGVVRWQIANANGGSNVGTFHVSDTAEFVEPDAGGEAIQTPSLPLNISGRLTRIAEVDEYRFQVTTDGLVVCRLEDRLGQPFHGMLSIRDANQQLVVDAADTTGKGVEALFRAQPGVTYTARIHDVEFGGDAAYVYRLSLARAAKVVTAVPLVVARGGTHTVDFVGWGLASGKQQIERVARQVSIPPDVAGEVFLYTFDTPAGPARATLALGDAVDQVLTPANPNEPHALSFPTVLSSTLEHTDVQMGLPAARFRFAAKKGDAVRFSVEADRFGSSVDPSLIVLSAEGKELARNDDLPGTTDAALDFKATLEGSYDLVVLDVSGLPPSPTSVYRLTATAATPDFSLTVPDRFDVPLGGTADLPLKVVRQGGWKEPLAVRLENLPSGVEVAGAAEIPQGKNDLKLSLAGSDQAAATAALATLVVTAKVGDQTIEHRHGPILVSTILKTRCKVKSAVQDGGRLVNRGTTYPADVIIERFEGYEGPVTLQMAATQQRQRRGIRAESIVVPAGQDWAQFPVFMPEWLETSLTARMNVVGVVQTPDPQGNMRHVLGAMDGMIVMSLEGALLKISHEPQERVVSAGQTAEIPIRVSRSARISGPVRIEALASDQRPDAPLAEPLTLAADQSSGIVRLKIPNDVDIQQVTQVTLRATLLKDGRWPVVSETTVPLMLKP